MPSSTISRRSASACSGRRNARAGQPGTDTEGTDTQGTGNSDGRRGRNRPAAPVTGPKSARHERYRRLVARRPRISRRKVWRVVPKAKGSRSDQYGSPEGGVGVRSRRALGGQVRPGEG